MGQPLKNHPGSTPTGSVAGIATTSAPFRQPTASTFPDPAPVQTGPGAAGFPSQDQDAAEALGTNFKDVPLNYQQARMQGFARPMLLRVSKRPPPPVPQKKLRPNLLQMVPSYVARDHEAKFKEESGPYHPYFLEATRLLSENTQKVDLSLLYDCQRLLALLIALFHFKLFRGMGNQNFVTIGMERMRNELGMRADHLRASHPGNCFSELERVGLVRLCKVEKVSGVIPPALSGNISEVEYKQLKYDSSQLTDEYGSDYWSDRCFQITGTFYRLGHEVRLRSDLPEFNPFSMGESNLSQTLNISQTYLSQTSRDMNLRVRPESDLSRASNGVNGAESDLMRVTQDRPTSDRGIRFKEELIKEEEEGAFRSDLIINEGDNGGLNPAQAEAYRLLTDLQASFPGYSGDIVYPQIARDLVISAQDGCIEEIKLQISYLLSEWHSRKKKREDLAGLLVSRIKNKHRQKDIPKVRASAPPPSPAWPPPKPLPARVHLDSVDPEGEAESEEGEVPVPVIIPREELPIIWSGVIEALSGRFRMSPQTLELLKGSELLQNPTRPGILSVMLAEPYQVGGLGSQDKSNIKIALSQKLKPAGAYQVTYLCRALAAG